MKNLSFTLDGPDIELISDLLYKDGDNTDLIAIFSLLEKQGVEITILSGDNYDDDDHIWDEDNHVSVSGDFPIILDSKMEMMSGTKKLPDPDLTPMATAKISDNEPEDNLVEDLYVDGDRPTTFPHKPENTTIAGWDERVPGFNHKEDPSIGCSHQTCQFDEPAPEPAPEPTITPTPEPNEPAPEPARVVNTPRRVAPTIWST